MPKYQRNLPRPGQASLGNPPVGPIGGMMPPQPGIPPQQQGMRPPMPPHGNHKFPSFLFSKRLVFAVTSLKLEVASTVKNTFSQNAALPI